MVTQERGLGDVDSVGFQTWYLAQLSAAAAIVLCFIERKYCNQAATVVLIPIPMEIGGIDIHI
jgi:hypothetical protein